MRAGWADNDADEWNWLAEAGSAYPGPQAAFMFMYGIATRLVEQLADATGEDRETVLMRTLQ
jgi:hypothetical protein